MNSMIADDIDSKLKVYDLNSNAFNMNELNTFMSEISELVILRDLSSSLIETVNFNDNNDLYKARLTNLNTLFDAFYDSIFNIISSVKSSEDSEELKSQQQEGEQENLTEANIKGSTILISELIKGAFISKMLNQKYSCVLI